MRLSKFKDEFGIQRAEVENWISRETLRTKYAETRPGSAREFSRANVFELAVVAALVRAGCRPSTAIAFTEPLIDDFGTGNLKRWLIFPLGTFDKCQSCTSFDEATLYRLASSKTSRGVIVIDVGGIAIGVEELFDASRPTN